MGSITLQQLVRKVGAVVQECWDVGSSLFELQRERSQNDDSLEYVGEEVKGLRSTLDAFHNSLRKVASRAPDEDDYQMIWDAADGAVKDCEKYLKHFVDLLSKVRGDDSSEDGSVPHLQAFRLRLHRGDLDKARVQLQGHKYNLSICLTMLIVHICSDLASQEHSPWDFRLTQLPLASKKLAKALRKLAMPPTYDAVEPQHVFRLKETAEKVLKNANSISNARVDSATTSESFDNLAITGSTLGQANRQIIEMWIKQLRIVQEEPDELEEPTFSDLPEVSMASPTPLPSTFDEVKSDSTRSTDHNSEEDDEFEHHLIRELTAQGKDHYENNNRAQAIDCLQRAVQYANDLENQSRKGCDLTEIRAILANLFLQKREYQTAEHHLLSIVNESAPTAYNTAYIYTAHLQLAQMYLGARTFDEAKRHCRAAIKGRMKRFGRNSPEAYEALQLQVLIFHSEGSQPEAEAILKMLPAHLIEETRDEIQAQSQLSPLAGAFPSPRSTSAKSPDSRGQRPSVSSDRSSRRRAVPSTITAATSPRAPQATRTSSDIGPSPPPKPSASRPFSPEQRPSHISLRSTATRTTASEEYDAFATNQTPVLNSGSASFHSSVLNGGSVSSNNMESLTLLAHAGYSGDFDANKALAWAIENGQERVVLFLLEGYPVTRPKRRFSLGNEKGYIMKKVSPNGNPKDKIPPLIIATIFNQVLIVRLLVERGANMSCKDDRGRTPIMAAAEHGSTEIIKLLLERGVTMDLSGAVEVWTPWHAAAQNGHEEVLYLLLEQGAAIDATDRGGQSGLKLASARGHLPACALLIDHGAHLDRADDTGWTPLHAAVKHGHTEVARLLLRSGASVNLVNTKQQTPLVVAAREGREAETKMLLHKDANLELADDRAWTPLLAACNMGFVEITQLLIAHGANVNAHCKRGSTPLDHALKGRHRAIQQFLKGSGAKKGSGMTEPHMQTHDAFMGYAM